jgi:hypothetical protein
LAGCAQSGSQQTSCLLCRTGHVKYSWSGTVWFVGEDPVGEGPWKAVTWEADERTSERGGRSVETENSVSADRLTYKESKKQQTFLGANQNCLSAVWLPWLPWWSRTAEASVVGRWVSGVLGCRRRWVGSRTPPDRRSGECGTVQARRRRQRRAVPLLLVQRWGKRGGDQQRPRVGDDGRRQRWSAARRGRLWGEGGGRR